MVNEKPATRMPREQRRNQLIEVALDVFAKHGYSQTTMDDIAGHAEVSKPVLYQHFENKRHLYFTLIDLQFEFLRNLITSRMEAVDPETETADEQTAYGAVYGVFEFTSDPRGHYRLILDTSIENPTELESRKSQFLDELAEYISPYLLDNSILDPVSSRFITSGIVSAVMYLACRWAEEHHSDQTSQDNIPLETAVQNTYRFVAHGAIGFDLSNNPSA